MKCTYSFDQLHLLSEKRFPDSERLLEERVAVRGVAAVTGEFRRRDRNADVIDLAAGGEGAVEWNVQNASPSLMHIRTSL